MADGPADPPITITKVHRLTPLDTQSSSVKRRSVITSFRRESASPSENSAKKDLASTRIDLVPKPTCSSTFHMNSSSSTSSKILPTLDHIDRHLRTSIKYKVPSARPTSVKGKRASILHRAQSMRMLQEKASFVSRRRQIFKRTRQCLLLLLATCIFAGIVLIFVFGSTTPPTPVCCGGNQPFIVTLLSGLKAMAMAIDPDGIVYIASAATNQIYYLNDTSLHVLAGTGDYGVVNGPVANAQFRYPCGIAVDSFGTVYVADRDSLEVRKITNGYVTTLLGEPSVGGIAPGGFDDNVDAVLINAPISVAVDVHGVVYVGYGTFIQGIKTDGSTFVLAGNMLRGYADGNGAGARFNGIRSIAVDALAEYLYVCDYYNHAIRRIEIATTHVATLLATGFYPTSGGGNVTSFTAPSGIFLVNSTLYVVDTFSNTVSSYDLNGTQLNQFGNGLYGNADGLNGSFGNPISLVVNASGAVYVGDVGNLLLRLVIY
ncbi:hypothetical protein SPRG_10206 [Saprolegnia parasitica CBS 223.65]|uniref:SMP-30/Gluconolactonase/LRE-like region domain-containing protein n=1 Tax=Saprolegnia parasitica (strain CBS 223.65) TaxID=695850 RepID=A0A067C2G4_SAPPC|nr:hypothetical protein SPRG_10206 [Saprolegnia parasitica CBS 223.65]KDO24673.1 hypothetical protein SPRG_10206 [Saprolegnia parasitica CBS 223.65]|eukprot:XP_012204554.1 hypothetical protein SPRG_10206 [Saprolegnia parasitica CBS 223.65]